MSTPGQSLRQHWPMPSQPRPIVVIGTGGIVKDAHLPAYRKAGFAVAGLYDQDRARAEALAGEWGIETVFDTLEQAAAADAVFDVAAPPVAHVAILSALPEGAAVLLQKPMGLDLADASAIRDVCRARRLTASVNFQLRYSAMMLAVADAIARGQLGELVEIEVHLNLVTPWHLFPHLIPNPRVEIVSHSIHYLDTIRALAGDPKGVFARSYAHPSSQLSDTRTTAILDYDAPLRATLSINHHHDFGRRFQDASFRIEGSEGAMMVKLGLLLDYPTGEPDELWFARRGGPWEQVPLDGAWFPDAFIGPMANLQRFAAGEDDRLATAVEDGWKTMALVEACYRAAAQPAFPIPTE
ncbi:Gfo/Idh/MocA family protein [Hephaestia sp. GCM10023244]|uniref:Gfo/Idh/MocA family protein n=1 Tax=unclassified Hephaestia TaxID=2631281 RepID=UPI0020771A9E|nr:Gfo/Idh/MocA family oxidoreductase [Hephaestia sp. MAHUQ-44]MCM8730541.1 Gfo/Idh/MocA family oxidoreductase [Hephaestia sp. MAHUQ-44]